MSIQLNTNVLKDVTKKLAIATEKSITTPTSSHIIISHIPVKDGYGLQFSVRGFDYCLSVITPPYKGDFSIGDEVVIDGESFISLVSKLETEEVGLDLYLNHLRIITSDSEYNFPVIKDEQIPADKYNLNPSTSLPGFQFPTNSFSQIYESNVKGLSGSIISSNIMRYIYFDEKGAITYTSNVYVSDFEEVPDTQFGVLVSEKQANLFRVFPLGQKVTGTLDNGEDTSSSRTMSFSLETSDGQITVLYLILSSSEVTSVFPAERLRTIANASSSVHVVIDKSRLEKALSRLMVFDKKFDATVLDYSQFEFGKESVKLVSLKNRNYETIPYLSAENIDSHTSVIRFADMLNQLKAIKSSSIDISFGDVPVLTLNSKGLKQLVPEVIIEDEE